jgi:hypothetical protein
MPNIALGLLKVDKHDFTVDASNRLNEFRLAVSQANSALRALQSVHGGIRMLVAPEYYWSGYDQIGQSKHKYLGPVPMTRDEKHALYSGLKQISASAGSLVLIAGSIFYQKPNGTRSSAYSLCPILRSGNFLLKSYKNMDDGAAQKNSKDYDFETKVSDPFLIVDNIGIGIEVCGDHDQNIGGGTGRLGRWNANANRTVDVQILVSDGAGPLANSVVARNGGYVVHCDIGGNLMDVAVFPAAGPYKRPDAIQPVSVSGAQVNGAMLVCYNLTV